MTSAASSIERVAAVTGAGSGIGRAVALALAGSGWTILALDRSSDGLELLHRELGPRVVGVQGDATTVAANRALAARGEQLGGIDALVCCVGIFDQYLALGEVALEQLDEAFTEIFNINVRSAVLGVAATRPQLVAHRGAVILTSSYSAFHAEGGGVLYGATKASLQGVVMHLARELAPAVRVNAVAPGATTGTAIGGLSCLGQRAYPPVDPARDERIRARSPLDLIPTPTSVSASYEFLLSDGAALMTGQTLHPDGGLAAGRVADVDEPRDAGEPRVRTP